MHHQRRLAFGATLTIVGLAIVGTGESDIGGAVSLLGWLSLFFAIHTFGRLGPEKPGTFMASSEETS
jgi:hypothetical protein